jgi:hypothetical protein
MQAGYGIVMPVFTWNAIPGDFFGLSDSGRCAVCSGYRGSLIEINDFICAVPHCMFMRDVV